MKKQENVNHKQEKKQLIETEMRKMMKLAGKDFKGVAHVINNSKGKTVLSGVISIVCYWRNFFERVEHSKP